MAGIKENTIIDVEGLSVTFDTVDGSVHALADVNFQVREGEILGIIGESGSGKSTLALSLMSLLPDNATVAGTVKYRGEVITDASNSGRAYFKLPRRSKNVLNEKLANIRWKDISMVFQGAMNSLNPVYTVRYQISEVFELHTDLTKEQINERIEKAAGEAGLNVRYLDSYPHELSGGMKQRAVLAMALALEPALVIADEPTTGLDVITQAKIISELKALRSNGKIKSMVIISHDVGVVSQLADRMAVLYAGKIMEIGHPSKIYLDQANPYSRALIESYPSIKATKKRVNGIPGSVPDQLHLPEGCFFAPRCSYAEGVCSSETPQYVDLGDGHLSLCHFADKFSKGEKKATREATEDTEDVGLSKVPEIRRTPLFNVTELSKYFQLTGNVLAALFSRSGNRIVHAVDHVSLNALRGEVLGVVGESGSGKTTLGKTLLLTYPATSGQIEYNFGDESSTELTEISSLHARNPMMKLYRSRSQLIFQDPYDSLNPKMSIFDIVSEPILAQLRIKDKKEETNWDQVQPETKPAKRAITYDEMVMMIYGALETANLRPATNYINRYPHELSGGERQRVSIARSLVLNPTFLVADEPISMLDVSIRANIMNLLDKLRNDLGMTILYISHDIASARYVSDKLAVMYLGEIVEMGPSEDIISQPLHPYTKVLIKAVPIPDPNWSSGELKIMGEIGNSINPKEGCRFYDRCVFRKDVCKETDPPVKTVDKRYYKCHFEQTELVENKHEDAEDSVETNVAGV